MRRMPLLVLSVLMLAGCSRYEGPLEVRQKYQREGKIDDPRYSIRQQEERGRARSAMLEDDYRIGPRTYVDRPDPIGRSAGIYSGVGQ